MNNFAAIHPGEYIRDELEARGWTQSDFAEIIGRSPKSLSQIVVGKASVTPRAAKEISIAFGTSAELWLNLQARFDLSKEEANESEIEARARLYDLFPVREMKKRGWISEWNDSGELESALCSFLDVPSITEGVSVSFSASTSQSIEEFNCAHIAWVRQATRLSCGSNAEKFSIKKIDTHIDDLLALRSHPREVRKVTSVLAKMGIRFVVVKHLANTKIDGAAIWIGPSKKTPLIALSLRYDRIDNFWQTLLHELSHIRNLDDSIIDIEDESKPQTEIENRADAEAGEMLIASNVLESFISQVGPRFSRSRVIQFANLHGIHPGIVVGQLHGKGVLEYKFLRKFLAPIRNIAVEHSISDGWDS